jgi:hypothetical protein
MEGRFRGIVEAQSLGQANDFPKKVDIFKVKDTENELDILKQYDNM